MSAFEARLVERDTALLEGQTAIVDGITAIGGALADTLTALRSLPTMGGVLRFVVLEGEPGEALWSAPAPTFSTAEAAVEWVNENPHAGELHIVPAFVPAWLAAVTDSEPS